MLIFVRYIFKVNGLMVFSMLYGVFCVFVFLVLWVCALCLCILGFVYVLCFKFLHVYMCFAVGALHVEFSNVLKLVFCMLYVVLCVLCFWCCGCVCFVYVFSVLL